MNTIDEKKFNPKLPCDMEPFAFIEKQTTVKTKYAGEIGIISFGALDYNAHYAPEFGGVAMVHFKPDLMIAVKYLPWDAKLRDEEHDRAVKFLEENIEIAPDKITEKFHYDFNYVLPAKKEQQRREYYEELKKAISDDDAPAPSAPVQHDVADGEEMIPLDE